MIDFTLTEEQRNLREMAHDFAVKEIRPVAWEYDRDGTWPEDVIEKAWQVGLMNSHIPEEFGGPGAGYLDGCLIEEELSWGCSGIQTTLGCNGLASTPVLIGGSEEIKKEYLGRLTEAPLLASFCLTEPDASSGASVRRPRYSFLTSSEPPMSTGVLARPLQPSVVWIPEQPQESSSSIRHPSR